MKKHTAKPTPTANHQTTKSPNMYTMILRTVANNKVAT